MDSRRSTGIITSIQLLRILAAVAVVIVHAEPTFKAGPSGVDVFFVISGFVIMVSSRDLFGAKGGWRTFLKNRIIRVVPLYWVATGVTIALMISINGHGPSLEAIFSSLFFIPHCNPCGPVATVSYLPVLSVGWTLNCEMFFYAIFAAAVALPMRMASVAILITLCGLVFFVPASESFPALPIYWSSPMLLEFAFGIVIAWVYLSGFRLPIAACTFAIITGLAMIYFNRETGNSPDIFHRLLIWGLPAAAIIAGAALTNWPSFGAIATKITRYLGAASYAVYLSHPIVIMLTDSLPMAAKITIAVAVGVAIHTAEKLILRSIRERVTVDEYHADGVVRKISP